MWGHSGRMRIWTYQRVKSKPSCIGQMLEIHTQEDLAYYVFAIWCSPWLTSKGKSGPPTFLSRNMKLCYQLRQAAKSIPENIVFGHFSWKAPITFSQKWSSLTRPHQRHPQEVHIPMPGSKTGINHRIKEKYRNYLQKIRSTSGLWLRSIYLYRC